MEHRRKTETAHVRHWQAYTVRPRFHRRWQSHVDRLRYPPFHAQHARMTHIFVVQYWMSQNGNDGLSLQCNPNNLKCAFNLVYSHTEHVHRHKNPDLYERMKENEQHLSLSQSAIQYMLYTMNQTKIKIHVYILYNHKT